MALATSASEFFTSIVGVFFVKSDIARKLLIYDFVSSSTNNDLVKKNRERKKEEEEEFRSNFIDFYL
jgi:hypothetical protein